MIVPRGVENRTIAEEDSHALLSEPAGTRNTAEAVNERMIEEPERI